MAGIQIAQPLDQAALSSLSSGHSMEQRGKIKEERSICKAVVLSKSLRSSFPCLCQLAEAAHIPWLVAPFFVFKPSDGGFSPFHIASL